jgi:hypothetical protein
VAQAYADRVPDFNAFIADLTSGFLGLAGGRSSSRLARTYEDANTGQAVRNPSLSQWLRRTTEGLRSGAAYSGRASMLRTAREEQTTSGDAR